MTRRISKHQEERVSYGGSWVTLEAFGLTKIPSQYACNFLNLWEGNMPFQVS